MRINNLLRFGNLGGSAAVAGFGLLSGSAQCEGGKGNTYPSQGQRMSRAIPNSLKSGGVNNTSAPKGSFDFLANHAIMSIGISKESAEVSPSQIMQLFGNNKSFERGVSSSKKGAVSSNAVSDLEEKYKREIEQINRNHNSNIRKIEDETNKALGLILLGGASLNPSAKDIGHGKIDAGQGDPDINITAEKTQERALNSIANKRRAADGEKDVIDQKKEIIEAKIADFRDFCEKNPFDDKAKLVKESEVKNLLKDLKESIEKANVSINLPELNDDCVVQGYRDQISEMQKQIGTWDQFVRFARPYSEAYGRFENLEKSFKGLSEGLESWKVKKRLASENFQAVQDSLIAKAKVANPEAGKYRELTTSQIIQQVDAIHAQLMDCILKGSITDELAQAISTHAASQNESIEETVKVFLGGITDNNEGFKKMAEQYNDLKSNLKEVKDSLALIKKANLDSVEAGKINERVDLIGTCKKEVALVEQEIKEYEELMLSIKNEQEDQLLFTKLNGLANDLNSKVSKLSGSKDEGAYKAALSAQQEFKKTLDVADNVWSRAPKEDVKSLRHAKLVEAIRVYADTNAVLSDEVHKQSFAPESKWSDYSKYGAVAVIGIVAGYLFKR